MRRMRMAARREEGAVLPLLALMILMLLGFAAFGVDLTAAYANQREAQSAADAGVLAGALQYLTDDSPTGEELETIIKSYVAANWGPKAPSDADWAACVDADRPPEYAAITGGSGDCISLKQVSDQPALLRLRLPDYAMPTAFASLLGFDTMAINAVATAELRYEANTKILPFSLPANPAAEECLSTPPSGLLPGEIDDAPCDGPAQGNFGIIDTPWFGAGEPHFTLDEACPKDATFNLMAPHNIAIGLDHVVTSWPDDAGNPIPADGDDIKAGKAHPGADHCDNATSGTIPYVLLTQPGNTTSGPGRLLLQKGFLGDDPSFTPADLPGRLRQTSPLEFPNSRLKIDTDMWDIDIDNIGLWKYLTDTSGNAVINPCHVDNFASGPPETQGRVLTGKMMDCLTSDTEDRRIFDTKEILDSPRFAIVPVLNYDVGQQYGNKWWAIKEMRPVYLHTTWYDCTSGSATDCLFLPDDFAASLTFDPMNRDSYSILMNPGEGAMSPCYLNGAGGCLRPDTSNFQLMGISALVLDWAMLPQAAENQYGSSAPYEVFLHMNE